METKETCSEDSSAEKPSEDTKQTVRIPASEDTETCTKDSCNKKDETVKQDQHKDPVPVKDGESKAETKEDSNTRGNKRWNVYICLSQLK